MFGSCDSYTGVTASTGPAICNNLKDNTSPSAVQCTYLTGSTCSNTTTCALSFTSLDNTTGPQKCPTVINSTSVRCKFTTGDTACVDGVCADKTNAVSAADCAGCRYIGVAACVAANTNCTGYSVSALSGGDSEKLAICNALTTDTDVYCTFVTTSPATTTCVARTCANIVSPVTSDAQCKKWLATCTFTGSACTN